MVKGADEEEKLPPLRDAGGKDSASKSPDGGRPARPVLSVPPAPYSVPESEEKTLSRFLTVNEACDFLRIARNTLYRALRDHRLPGAFRVGSDWRIDTVKLLEQFNSPPGDRSSRHPRAHDDDE
jgi:excisionase family DNA binding protein